MPLMSETLESPMNSQIDEAVEIKLAPFDLAVHELDHEIWSSAQPVLITHYWSGEPAPQTRHVEARLIWTPTALIARFEGKQTEPLIISSSPQTKTKTFGLWDRDVCEIFLAPNVGQPNRYFEFEAAPTGEWVDLAIRQNEEHRETEWDYRSGMTSAARVEPDRVLIAMRLPWSLRMPKPAPGDQWRGNLCRCIGSGEERGYLAWQPTLTDKANFHVPDKFGILRFSEMLNPMAPDS